MMPATPGTCGFCGGALDTHDLNFRLRYPDAVAELLEGGLDISELEGDAALDEVIKAGDSFFLRVLLRVRLADGARVTFGTWLEVALEDVKSVAEVWSTPAYRDVVVSGRLANRIPPWGDEVLGAAATATVLDVDHSPYLTSSPDGVLAPLLDDEWPAEDVLAELPH